MSNGDIETCSKLESDDLSSTKNGINNPGLHPPDMPHIACESNLDNGSVLNAETDETNTEMLASATHQSSDNSNLLSNVSSVETVVESAAAAAMEIAAANPMIKENVSFLPEVEALLDQKLETLRRLREERKSFMEKMEQAEAEVNRIVEHLCSMVDNKANELLSTAASVKADSLAQFESARVELESKTSSMRINEEYVQQLLSNAGPEDLIKLAPAVHLMKKQFQHENDHAMQLVATTVYEEQMATLNEIADFDFASLVGNAEDGNLLGHVSLVDSVEETVEPGRTAPYLSNPQCLLVISTGSIVRGLAFLKSHVYVLQERCSTIDVRESETDDCRTVEQIVVEQLTYPDCIVGSETSQCVFVSDCQISGLFQISHTRGSSVTLIPLDGVPSGLSLSSSGHLVFTYVEAKKIVIASAVDVSLLRCMSADGLTRPICASPAPGEDNGVVVCDETDRGLIWFLCGHRFEGAAASLLEEPLQLYQLSGLSCLVSDSYGRYVGLNSSQGTVQLFDASFSKVDQSLATGPGMSCIASNPLKGMLIVGHLDGTIKLFRVMKTRRRIEINLRKLT